MYSRGSDELVYDSVLRIVRTPSGAPDLPGAVDVARDLPTPVPVDSANCSPDGSRVLMLSQRSDARWWLVNVDGSGLREIDLSRPGTATLRVQWEPDGKSLLVLRQADGLPARTSLTREFLGGRGSSVVRSQTLIPLSAGRDVATVSVAPDGRHLMVGIWHQFGRGPQVKSSLWLVPVSDDPAAPPPPVGSWREIATDETLTFSEAVWSPDGAWVAFRGGEMTSGDRGSTPMAGHLYLMRPDGSQMHRVPGALNRNSSSYQWLPDGGTLAFLTGSYRNESDFAWPNRLALLRMDGGSGPLLTDHRGLGGYLLSPDGRAILTQVGDSLVVQPLASDGRTQVIDSAGYFGGWSWCAQGRSP